MPAAAPLPPGTRCASAATSRRIADSPRRRHPRHRPRGRARTCRRAPARGEPPDPRAGIGAGADTRRTHAHRAPGADLLGADLAGRDLRGAELRGALLIAADLRGADLSFAELIGADLRDAPPAAPRPPHGASTSPSRRSTPRAATPAHCCPRTCSGRRTGSSCARPKPARGTPRPAPRHPPRPIPRRPPRTPCNCTPGSSHAVNRDRRQTKGSAGEVESCVSDQRRGPDAAGDRRRIERHRPRRPAPPPPAPTRASASRTNASTSSLDVQPAHPAAVERRMRRAAAR